MSSATDEDLNRLRARIRALREKTVSNGCTEEEAVAASVKAAELMETHGLSEETLNMSRYVTLTKRMGRRSPLEQVYGMIATYTDCLPLLQREGRRVDFCYFGMERNTLIADYIHDVITAAAEGAVKEFRTTRLYRARRTSRTRNIAVRAFREGFANSVSRKLAQTLWLRVDRDQIATTRANLDHKLKERGYHVTSAKGVTKAKGAFTNDARGSGVCAGANVDVRAPVDGSRGPARLLTDRR